MTGCSNWRSAILATLFCGLASGPSFGLDRVEFTVTDDAGALASSLRAASLLMPMARGSSDAPQEILAKARQEYAVLVDTLYANGHYAAEVRVKVDGVEAADIALLDVPKSIGTITVTVTAGPLFVFDQARVAPVPEWSRPIDGFALGQPAKSGLIVDATARGIEDWRTLGHAKAEVSQSTLLADHAQKTVTADVTIDTGPVLRFGPLTIQGAQSMRAARIAAIAALPEGKVFSPADLERVAKRLRRTGAFRSVVMEEAEKLQGDTVPITAVLVEEKLRRLAVSADVASLEGLSLGVSAAHRNLFGGAEKLTLAASASRIGVDTGGLDYTLSAGFERPATFTPDTTFALGVVFDREQDVRTTNDALSVTAKLTQYFTNSLTGNGGVAYSVSRAVDPKGTSIYRTLSFPFGLSWDTRNVKKSASDGVYITSTVKPFIGFGAAENGARIGLDARGYRAVTRSESLVLALRVQAGMIVGSSLAGTPREDLFYSGGPATVRGQPYKSLGISALVGSDGAPFQTGGTHYLGGSFEARQKVSQNFGLVGFVDAGRIDLGGFFASAGNWHAGAGLGLRYMTAIGPVRLDVARPIGGATGNGTQIYVGIGQAF